MKYEIVWTKTSLNSLKKIEKNIAKRIINKIKMIRNNPFIFIKKLKNLPFYSLRIGEYRAILLIEKKKLIIFVLEVGHRKKIYEKIK
jgi:mRNA interferase RelE/StbE